MQQFNEQYKNLLDKYIINEGIFGDIGTNIANIVVRSTKAVGERLKKDITDPAKELNPFYKAFSETSDTESKILKEIIKEIKNEYNQNPSFGLRNKVIIVNGKGVKIDDLLNNINNFKLGNKTNVTEALKVISEVSLNDLVKNVNKQDKQLILNICKKVLSERRRN